MKREIYKFSAPWCRPCADVAPIIKKVTTELSIPVINIDVDADPEIAKKYNVKGIPTLILFEDGEPTKRLSGNFTESKLRDFLS